MDVIPTISKTDSYQYPVSHFGHLTDGQQAALDNFKQLCEDEGYYTPAKAGRIASHDDETLLRYLRARKFSPQEGFRQFKETEDWRKENRIVEYYDVIDVQEYDTARKLYPQWTGRRDRRGIPVYVFEVAPLNSKAITAYQNSLKVDKSPPLNAGSTVPPRMMRLHALYENLTRFVLPLCSAVKVDRPHPETPVSQSNNIVDISGVGLRQFWNLKSHMQDASTVATALYPETLDRIFIIGAPSFFPTVWSWIKRWFDPITVSKIFILSAADMTPTLEKYIAPENIPRKYGGTLDYTFGMLPVLEPAIRAVVAPASGADFAVPAGPIKWFENAAGELELLAVGSEAGARRNVVAGRMVGDVGFIHGIERENTSVDWAEENFLSTTGTATQPTGEGDPEFGREFLGAESPADGAVEGGELVVGTAAVEVSKDVTESGKDATESGKDVTESGTAAAAVEAVDGEAVEPAAEVEAGNGAVVMALRQAEQHREPDAAEKSYVEQAKDAVTSAASVAGAAVDQVLVGSGLKGEIEEGSEEKLLSEKGAAGVEHSQQTTAA